MGKILLVLDLDETLICGMLNDYVPSGTPILGIEEDPEYDGWRVHSDLARKLRESGRAWEIQW